MTLCGHVWDPNHKRGVCCSGNMCSACPGRAMLIPSRRGPSWGKQTVAGTSLGGAGWGYPRPSSQVEAWGADASGLAPRASVSSCRAGGLATHPLTGPGQWRHKRRKDRCPKTLVFKCLSLTPSANPGCIIIVPKEVYLYIGWQSRSSINLRAKTTGFFFFF